LIEGPLSFRRFAKDNLFNLFRQLFQHLNELMPK
jgi:hypothetical protein